MATDREESHKEYVTLREYFDSRLLSIERATEVAITAAQRAVEKAEIANNSRFAAVNEFRQALQDQTREYLPRSEFNIQHKSIEDKVDSVIRSVGEASKFGEGRSKAFNAVGLIVYAAITSTAAALGVLISFIRH